MKQSEKGNLTEKLKALLDATKDEDIEKVGMKLDPIGRNEALIGSCSIGLRILLTRVRLMEEEGMSEAGPNGTTMLSFENKDLDTQFYFLAILAQKLFTEEFGDAAIVRKEWDVVEKIPSTLN